MDKFCMKGCMTCNGTDLYYEKERSRVEFDESEVRENVNCLECEEGRFIYEKMCLKCPYPALSCTYVPF